MNLEQARAALRAQMPDAIGSLRAKAAGHGPDIRQRIGGYRITNAAGDDGDTATVRIFDEIWWLGINAEDLTAELDSITTPNIRVEINSPGGDVFDGITIYNALRKHPAHVTTSTEGIAASIASVIFQAGDRRVMQEASELMIHNASGLTYGDTNDHADMASILAQQDTKIAGIYAARSGGDIDHFRELMNDETWLLGDRAVEEGLADEIAEPPAKADDDQPSDGTGKRPTSNLSDEIAAAVDAVDAAIGSATRVAALRAEAGKSLSNRIQDGLVGLQMRIQDIDDVLSPSIDDDSAAERAALDAAYLEAAERVRNRIGVH